MKYMLIQVYLFKKTFVCLAIHEYEVILFNTLQLTCYLYLVIFAHFFDAFVLSANDYFL